MMVTNIQSVPIIFIGLSFETVEANRLGTSIKHPVTMAPKQI